LAFVTRKYFEIKIFQSFLVYLLSAVVFSTDKMRTNDVGSLTFAREIQAVVLKMKRFYSN